MLLAGTAFHRPWPRMQQLVLLLLPVVAAAVAAGTCPRQACQLLDRCSGADDCAPGLYCGNCPSAGAIQPVCIRGQAVQPTSIVKDLPFNNYSWLVTHNSYSNLNEPSHTGSNRVTFYNQEDSVTNQLMNGVRGLMLDMYDFQDDVWLCHSFRGHCYNFTAFEPAINTLKEVEAFLAQNPSEIVTIIIEDYVHAPKGLTKLFTNAGLLKYWFPVSEMPLSGRDWPTVTDMISKNHRLLVFTSIASKEADEGIAYQWNYVLENEAGDPGIVQGSCPNRKESRPLNSRVSSLFLQNYFSTIPVQNEACKEHSTGLAGMVDACYKASGNKMPNFFSTGDPGIVQGSCPNRKESRPLNSRASSLFLQNYFSTIPVQNEACKEHSTGLAGMVDACYKASGNKMPNFLSVNFYMRSDRGGVFDMLDKINGRSLCGCDSVAACKNGGHHGVCSNANQTRPVDVGGTYSGYIQFKASASGLVVSDTWVKHLAYAVVMLLLN